MKRSLYCSCLPLTCADPTSFFDLSLPMATLAHDELVESTPRATKKVWRDVLLLFDLVSFFFLITAAVLIVLLLCTRGSQKKALFSAKQNRSNNTAGNAMFFFGFFFFLRATHNLVLDLPCQKNL